ncbi:MAG: hypothetical protein KDB53_21405 [Planctomycetes bacterium]|nr:hypothetical protein [Planctomycetota bacterium]
MSRPKELQTEAKPATPETVSEPRESPFESFPYVDRRDASDRRGAPTSVWNSLWGKGLRARGRREGEDQNIYVDLYGRREIMLVVLILVLNVLDAYFTLDYIEKGGSEANPVAQGLLDLGDEWFVYAKSFLVGLCLVFLLVHKKFSYVNYALGFLVAFYSSLLAYHIFLQVRYYLHHH